MKQLIIEINADDLETLRKEVDTKLDDLVLLAKYELFQIEKYHNECFTHHNMRTDVEHSVKIK